MKTKIITPDSPEAAQYRTDIRGWVSRNGKFYGEKGHAEHAARYEGSTHLRCEGCGALYPKSYWMVCDDCRAKRELERYLARPRAKWDGKAMLYSEVLDRFFDSLDDADDWASLEDDENPMPLEEMRLVICEPDYARPIDLDYWQDQLPDNGELPAEIEDALAEFNEAISGILLSWRIGKCALDLSDEASTGA